MITKFILPLLLLSNTNAIYGNSGFAIKTCEKIISNFNKGFSDLYLNLDKNEKKHISSHSKSILNSRPQHCSDGSKQNTYHQLIVSSIKSSSKKISVLLNTKGPFAKESEAILNGIYSGLQFMQRKDLKARLQVIDTSKSDKNALAKALLMHNSDLIIAKVDSKNISYFKKASEMLRIPIVMLNNGTSFRGEFFSFFVYPHKKVMGTTLANSLAKRNIKKIAVLSPNNTSSTIIQALQSNAKNNVQIIKKASYQSQDFHSLDSAIQKLLSIDYTERAEEYRELVELKEKEAKENEVAFNKNQVYLPPKYDFDSIYIADDFRVSRHIAKLLKFYGVKKLPLIGNSSWRDIALVKPYDKFFQDSFFVDYIGLYNKLPFNVKQQSKDSTLLSAVQSESIDHKLMGYRASTIVASAFNKKFSTKAKLAKIMRNQVLPKDVFFQFNKAFDKNNRSIWPAFIFNIAKEKIELENHDKRLVFARQ